MMHSPNLDFHIYQKLYEITTQLHTDVTKFDNHVNLHLCEISMELQKGSNFLSYRAFCFSLKASLLSGDLSRVERGRIHTIIRRMNEIFYLNEKDSGDYVANFFLFNLFEKYEEVASLTKASFNP